MSKEVTRRAGSRAQVVLIASASELVEVGERYYIGAFRLVGAGVMVTAAGATVAVALRKPFALLPVLLGLSILAAGLVVVRFGRSIYAYLRASGAAVTALVAAAGAVPGIDGHANNPLGFCAAAVVSLAAIVGGARAALTAGATATASYGLGVLLHGLTAHRLLDAGDFGGWAGVAIGYLLWPQLTAALVDRLGRFLLELNSLASPSTGSPAHVPTQHEHEASSSRSVRRLAPAKPRARTTGREGGSLGLTARQLEVVALLCDGLRYAEIAACLSISVRQVRRHVEGAMRRLGVRSLNEVVARAVAAGLVPRRD